MSLDVVINVMNLVYHDSTSCIWNINTRGTSGNHFITSGTPETTFQTSIMAWWEKEFTEPLHNVLPLIFTCAWKSYVCKLLICFKPCHHIWFENFGAVLIRSSKWCKPLSCLISFPPHIPKTVKWKLSKTKLGTNHIKSESSDSTNSKPPFNFCHVCRFIVSVNVHLTVSLKSSYVLIRF